MERVIYSNYYVGYEITTTDDCKICGADVNFYYLNEKTNKRLDKKVFSMCWNDLSEMLPKLNEFVKTQRNKDEEYE